MTLVACKECGEKISDKALACPKCGAPPGASLKLGARLGAAAVGVCIAIGILVVALNSNSPPRPVQGGTSPATSEAQIQTPTRPANTPKQDLDSLMAFHRSLKAIEDKWTKLNDEFKDIMIRASQGKRTKSNLVMTDYLVGAQTALSEVDGLALPDLTNVESEKNVKVAAATAKLFYQSEVKRVTLILSLGREDGATLDQVASEIQVGNGYAAQEAGAIVAAYEALNLDLSNIDFDTVTIKQ